MKSVFANWLFKVITHLIWPYFICVLIQFAMAATNQKQSRSHCLVLLVITENQSLCSSQLLIFTCKQYCEDNVKFPVADVQTKTFNINL